MSDDMTKAGFFVPGEQEDHFIVNDRKSAKVFTVPFSPLEQRIQAEQPELFDGLQKLKAEIGPEAFEKYFSTVQSLKRNETTVMLIVAHPMQRTSIEANYLPAIERAFDVQYVRIVSM